MSDIDVGREGGMTTRDVSIATGSIGKDLTATLELLREDVLGSAAEMVREIQKQVPEYASPDDEQEARALRRGVDLALRRYVELLDLHLGRDATFAARNGGAGPAIDWQEVYHSAGANEMRAGRSLEALHAAVRVCARVANRHLQAFAARHALAPSVVAWLAEAIFDNIDEVARASVEGYAHAQENELGELERRRRRLVDLLVADPPSSQRALAAAAAAARWRMPRRLAAVVLAAPGPLARTPVLSPDILTAFDHVRPWLIVPDPKSRAYVRTIVNSLAQQRVAVGLAVSPVEAGRSLRWAELSLDLAGRGRIPPERIIWCGDHLATLAVFQDEALLAALAERRLAPLAGFREDKRRLLAETLQAWLRLNMNANEVAMHLNVHPQTVRHRLRRLTDLFRDEIRDPQARFELEIALQAERRDAVRMNRAARHRTP